MKYLLLLLLLAGCAGRPLKPGIGVINLPSVSSIVQQSENPKTESTQSYKKITEGDKVVETIDTKIGAAQKDVAREMTAKLASLRPVMWVGILLFIFGVASAVWPPLKLIVGSVTTSAVCALAGGALVVLPTVIVGNETLILVSGVAVAFIWFFAKRHGDIAGQNKILKRD